MGASEPPIAARALLFDLGGVLIEIDFGRCMAAWARRAGVAVSAVSGRFSFDAAYEDHERGLLEIGDYFEHLRQTLDVDLSDDELLNGWNDIYVGPDEDVGALLLQVKSRLPLYAFTNSNPSHQAAWSLRFEQQLSVFDRVFVSSEVGHRKPDRVAFELVARQIGVSSTDIVFFDDSIENVEGARAVGMQAVHVTSADSVREALARRGLIPA